MPHCQTPGRLVTSLQAAVTGAECPAGSPDGTVPGKGLRAQPGPSLTVWPQAGHVTSPALGFVFVNGRGWGPGKAVPVSCWDSLTQDGFQVLSINWGPGADGQGCRLVLAAGCAPWWWVVEFLSGGNQLSCCGFWASPMEECD